MTRRRLRGASPPRGRRPHGTVPGRPAHGQRMIAWSDKCAGVWYLPSRFPPWLLGTAAEVREVGADENSGAGG